MCASWKVQKSTLLLLAPPCSSLPPPTPQCQCLQAPPCKLDRSRSWVLRKPLTAGSDSKMILMSLETADDKEHKDKPSKPALDAPHVARVHLRGGAAWQHHLERGCFRLSIFFQLFLLIFLGMFFLDEPARQRRQCQGRLDR